MRTSLRPTWKPGSPNTSSAASREPDDAYQRLDRPSRRRRLGCTTRQGARRATGAPGSVRRTGRSARSRRHRRRGRDRGTAGLRLPRRTRALAAVRRVRWVRQARPLHPLGERRTVGRPADGDGAAQLVEAPQGGPVNNEGLVLLAAWAMWFALLFALAAVVLVRGKKR